MGQVEMLLGKAYSSWQGHSGDAIAVYDNLIATHPDDFRGFLAKVHFCLSPKLLQTKGSPPMAQLLSILPQNT
jgi:hypothetical protein